MKIVLTGGTGFVGGEVLSQLLDHAAVEQVTCLTRRPLDRRHGKLRVLLCEDFTRFDEAAVRPLRDHGACLWTLGAKTADLADVDALRRVTYEFTLAFARAMCAGVEGPFRLCYLSGMGADPTETAWFPWEKHTRHLKGRTERDLQQLAVQHNNFSTVAFRPAGILSKESSRWMRALLSPIIIGVEQLATAMIRIALDPTFLPPASTLSNAQIKQLAAATTHLS